MRVGAAGSLGPFGTHDMAGNVKEWVWNESSGGRRFVLGGAWFEARYQFHDEDARGPFEREPGFGFRCMQARAPIDAKLQAMLTEPIVTLERDIAEFRPVSDEVFDAYRTLYDYDPRPLDSRVEERDEANRHWSLERVTLTAAYGGERLPVLLVSPALVEAALPGRRLFSRVGRGARALEPRDVHAVAGVPAAKRPRRRVSDLPADLRAPARSRPAQTSCARSACSADRTCAAPSTIWRRGRTSIARGSPSTASASAHSSGRSTSPSSRGSGPACCSRAGSRRGRCRPRPIR